MKSARPPSRSRPRRSHRSPSPARRRGNPPHSSPTATTCTGSSARSGPGRCPGQDVGHARHQLRPRAQVVHQEHRVGPRQGPHRLRGGLKRRHRRSAAGLVGRSGRLARLSLLGRCRVVRSHGAEASSGMGSARPPGKPPWWPRSLRRDAVFLLGVVAALSEATSRRRPHPTPGRRPRGRDRAVARRRREGEEAEAAQGDRATRGRDWPTSGRSGSWRPSGSSPWWRARSRRRVRAGPCCASSRPPEPRSARAPRWASSWPRRTRRCPGPPAWPRPARHNGCAAPASRCG